MDDDAYRFGTLTQQMKGWLRVNRFLSASMVVYLRFNCCFQVERFERSSAAVRTRSCARHELGAAARAARLVRRFGWPRHRGQFFGLQTGPLNEFFRSALPGGSKPLFGRQWFRLIRGTNRQQRITQVEQGLSGKTLEAARRTQDLGHSQRMEVFQQMPGEHVRGANGGWRREEHGEKRFQAF